MHLHAARRQGVAAETDAVTILVVHERIVKDPRIAVLSGKRGDHQGRRGGIDLPPAVPVVPDPRISIPVAPIVSLPKIGPAKLRRRKGR